MILTTRPILIGEAFCILRLADIEYRKHRERMTAADIYQIFGIIGVPFFNGRIEETIFLSRGMGKSESIILEAIELTCPETIELIVEMCPIETGPIIETQHKKELQYLKPKGIHYDKSRTKNRQNTFRRYNRGG